MQFTKYQKLAHLGNKVTDGILNGTVHVFPKLDGTNASIWLSTDDELRAGSRNRELSTNDDNRGFYNDYVRDNDTLYRCIKSFQEKYNTSNVVLYGEWLVQHTVSYEDAHYRTFYLFDVLVDGKYLTYDEYVSVANHHVTVIAPITVLSSPKTDDIIACIEHATYCSPDTPEGVVVKNYDYTNEFGDVIWAKCISDRFVNNKGSKTKKPRIYSDSVVETTIALDYVTEHLVDKIITKIGEFSMKNMKLYIDLTFKDVVEEYVYEYVTRNNYPTINTKHLLVEVTKQLKVHLVPWQRGLKR
ncbi:MAG: RNA ligase family protein [Bacilli bacterium]